MAEKKKWWVPILNRTLDFVLTSFCPICDGQVFKDGYSYVCQECLDTLAWVRDTRCKLCGIPMSGMDFQGWRRARGLSSLDVVKEVSVLGYIPNAGAALVEVVPA